MFDKIRKAYEDMQTNLLDNSKFINNTKWGGSDDDGSSSGSSGGGSSGGGSGGKKKYSATYPAIGSAKGGTLKGYDTEEAAIAAAKSKINSICRQLSGSSSSAIGQWARTFYDKITVKKYARGGIADFTGPMISASTPKISIKERKCKKTNECTLGYMKPYKNPPVSFASHRQFFLS